MADLPLSPDVLKNLLPLVTKGIASDKLAGLGEVAGSLFGGGSSGGGLGALGGLAGSLFGGGGASGGNKALDTLASVVRSVLSSGSLGKTVGDVFSSRFLQGNSVAAVAQQFGIGEGVVNEYSEKALGAIRDQFLKRLG